MTAHLIATVVTASVQGPQTPGPVPSRALSPQMSPVVQTCVSCQRRLW